MLGDDVGSQRPDDGSLRRVAVLVEPVCLHLGLVHRRATGLRTPQASAAAAPMSGSGVSEDATVFDATAHAAVV